MSEPDKNLPKEYLTIGDLAYRLTVKPKTIKNKMASGIFRRGVHYFSPKGIGPRFKWSAVVAWLEERVSEQRNAAAGDEDGIPMARGYYLGSDHRSEKSHPCLDKRII